MRVKLYVIVYIVSSFMWLKNTCLFLAFSLLFNASDDLSRWEKILSLWYYSLKYARQLRNNNKTVILNIVVASKPYLMSKSVLCSYWFFSSSVFAWSRWTVFLLCVIYVCFSWYYIGSVYVFKTDGLVKVNHCAEQVDPLEIKLLLTYL